MVLNHENKREYRKCDQYKRCEERGNNQGKG